MATMDVIDWNKKKVGTVEVNPDVFATEVRKDVLHGVVRWQLACRRQGTHKAKTKGEVSGGGKKPFRQKGTGNARQGSIRSPLMEGGGVVFPPKPRDYSYNLPRKVKQLGLRSALSYLHKEGRFFVVDSMTSTEGKTKELAQRLKNFGYDKAVLICSQEDAKFDRAARNLGSYCYYSVQGLNVYDLLRYDVAIVTQDCVKQIEARCGVEG